MPNVEWSGVLFYETEGEFLSDSFRCIAQELYLMDIGTAGSTEYEYGPEFIKFLMDNPKLKAMCKGHIHSHCRMGVFFSGTDKEELHGNCKNHNFYLSLIVNNDNEMIAKLAFVAKQKNITLEYRSEKGKAVNTVVENATDETYTFVHDCKITLPEKVDYNSFQGRINELRGKKEETSWDRGFSEKFIPKEKNHGKSDEDGVYNFLVKLLNEDFHARGSLTDALYKQSNKNVNSKFIRERCGEYYKDCFRADKNMGSFSRRIEEACRILDKHVQAFPRTVSTIKEALVEAITYEYNDSETN